MNLREKIEALRITRGENEPYDNFYMRSIGYEQAKDAALNAIAEHEREDVAKEAACDAVAAESVENISRVADALTPKKEDE